MLLSEAIRLGSMLGPQLRHRFIDGSASCAIGAAALALGCRSNDSYCIVTTVDILFGSKTREYVPSPTVLLQSLNLKTVSLLSLLSFLNDSAGWTREQIADWLVTSGNDCESVPLSLPGVHSECQADLVTA